MFYILIVTIFVIYYFSSFAILLSIVILIYI